MSKPSRAVTSQSWLSKLRRWSLEVLVLGGIIVLIILWQQRNMLAADGSVSVPNTYFVTLDGETRALLAQDKPTLLYFFAPWCQVCELSVNNVDAFDANKVNVVKVALSYQNLNEIEAFATRTQTQRNIVLGNQQTQADFNITAFPSVYIIDEAGAIVGRSRGYTTSLGYKLRLAFGT